MRSSATAEDLPEMSFAGQQDTYLNVVGDERLLQGRGGLLEQPVDGARHRLPPAQRHRHSDEVALAVVVQHMVESQASGVLFTANPLTGLRTETVIDATLGLGEALVSGQVEPDHYVVDPAAGRILSKTLGAKALSIHGQPAGGTQVLEQPRGVQALPDEQILELARLGQQVARLFGFPQDIEWAWAQETAVTCCNRARSPRSSRCRRAARRAAARCCSPSRAVQGMLDPMTPLGRDAMQADLCQRRWSVRRARDTARPRRSCTTPASACGSISPPSVSNSIGRRIVPVVLSLVEPTIRQAVRADPGRPTPAARLSRAFSRARPLQAGALLHAPLAANIFLNLLSPRRRRDNDRRQRRAASCALMEARAAAHPRRPLAEAGAARRPAARPGRWAPSPHLLICSSPAWQPGWPPGTS